MGIEPVGLAPFVPGGSDFAKSRALFRELGFEELWSNDGYVGFQQGRARFILQDVDDASFAGHLMVETEVFDLDAWWQTVAGKELSDRFAGFRLQATHRVPLGSRGALHRPGRRVLARGAAVKRRGSTPRGASGNRNAAAGRPVRRPGSPEASS